MTAFQINNLPFVGGVDGNSVTPTITRLQTGGFVSAWYQGGLKGQIFDSNGIEQGTEFQISSYNSVISGLKNIGFVALWKNTFPTPPQLTGQIFDFNGNPLGSAFTSSCLNGCNYYSIAELKNSGFVVIWDKYVSQTDPDGVTPVSIDRIFAQLYNDNGNTIGTEFEASLSFPIYAFLGSPKVSGLESGGFTITWKSINPYNAGDTSSYYGLVGVVFDSNGNAIGSQFKAAASTQSSPLIPTALQNGGFAVAWSLTTSTFDVYSQLYSPTGTAIGAQIHVNNFPSSGGHDIKGLPNGNFIVSWNQASKAQTFDATGNKVGDELTLVQSCTILPATAGLLNSALAVTWSDCLTPPTLYGEIFPPVAVVPNNNTIIPTPSNHTFSSPLSLNQYAYSLMSLKVYKDASSSSYNLLSGWSEMEQSAMTIDDPSSGYHGQAYQNIAEETVVIAHRGTDTADTDINSQDRINDGQLFLGIVPSQFTVAQTFINQVQQYIINNNLNFQYMAFTGHSLGATLAELSCAKYHLPAITFESPGSNGILSGTILNGLFGTTTFSSSDKAFANLNIMTINAAPNGVNTIDNHLGSITRAYPPVEALATCGLKQPSLTVFKQPYTFSSKTIDSQHSMKHIVDQFNPVSNNLKVATTASNWPSGIIFSTQCSGYDYYSSEDANPYYKNSYVKSALLVDLEGVSAFFGYGLGSAFLFANSLLSSCSYSGVSIVGDDSSNFIWGTTNYADIVTTGSSNDFIFLHKGDDKCTDSGGFDTYIAPLNKMGNKQITDNDGLGTISLANLLPIAGTAYPIINSACPIITTNDYLLNVDKGGAYLLKQSGNDLIITAECSTSIQTLENSITIYNFNWGNFRINKYIGSDIQTLVGSDGNEVLDCSTASVAISTCYMNSFKGQDILIAAVGQNAVLVGSDSGTKVFVLKSVDSVNSQSHNSMHLQSTSSNVITVSGIKENDTIAINPSSIPSDANLSQNGTDAFLALVNGNTMHAQIALGNSFLTFTLLNGNITVKNIDMMQFINSTYLNKTNIATSASEDPSSEGSSNAGVIAAAVLVPLVFLAAVAFIGYKHHYGEGFSCLHKQIATTAAVVSLSVMSELPKTTASNTDENKMTTFETDLKNGLIQEVESIPALEI